VEQPPKKKKKKGNAKPKKLVVSRDLLQSDVANCGKNFHKDSTPIEKKRCWRLSNKHFVSVWCRLAF